MKKTFLSAAIVMLMSVFTTVFAADEHEASGTINSIDNVNKTLNISHGPITTMGMGAMTMDFAVADPFMLKEVKPGQKIKFVVTTDRKGRFVILDMQ
ncbi:MAG: copper-binding protein [Gammaproteobacteria bacterium]|nr:copper-binding protein [Gammaproteobacteria bacterium]